MYLSFKMREFYRWEHNIPFGTKLSNELIGDWLTERENDWDDLENESFVNIHISDLDIEPFDTSRINSLIEKEQLIYSAGYGTYNKPTFFLAELENKTIFDDYQLYICGQEYARELASPPGMNQGNAIFIRKESLKRFIWEKYEESHWYNKDNPLFRALSCYDFKHKPDTAVEQMASLEADTVLYHEIGEILSNRILGKAWDEMLLQLPRSKNEFMLRAIKDHLADAVSTIPRLIENKDDSQIHFYFANLTGMRKEIFPSLMSSYQQWLNNNNISDLALLAEKSRQHWTKLAKQLLNHYQKNGINAVSEFDKLIYKNIL